MAGEARAKTFLRRALPRLGGFLLLLPIALLAFRAALDHAPDAWVGKWFSAYWIDGAQLALLGLLALLVSRLPAPTFVRKWWWAWTGAGVVVSLAALLILVSLNAFGESWQARALTTLPCVVPGSPLAEIRSCRSWNFGWTEPNSLVLARGPLEASFCQARQARGATKTKCDLGAPLTWREVPCTSVALPKAARCFKCEDREIGGLDGASTVAYLRILALVHGCRDAIYFAGDSAGLEEMKRELPAL